jgi:hypothetical protein
MTNDRCIQPLDLRLTHAYRQDLNLAAAYLAGLSAGSCVITL